MKVDICFFSLQVKLCQDVTYSSISSKDIRSRYTTQASATTLVYKCTKFIRSRMDHFNLRPVMFINSQRKLWGCEKPGSKWYRTLTVQSQGFLQSHYIPCSHRPVASAPIPRMQVDHTVRGWHPDADDIPHAQRQLKQLKSGSCIQQA